jgi:predicted nucleic acid-binding protein
MAEALLDTNVFVHALMLDEHSVSSQGLLDALAAGTEQAVLDSLVVHE